MSWSCGCVLLLGRRTIKLQSESQTKMVSWICSLGKSLKAAIAALGFAFILLSSAIRITLFGRKFDQPVRLRHIILELHASGVQALPVVILMSATIGIMLAIQGIHSLAIFGAESQVTFGLALSIPREFAPLITGIIVAGRSGSQLASKVGSMRLNGELDALTAMGIAPVRFIVAPSLIGLMLSLPILVATANLSAFVAAGLYLDTALGITPVAYWHDVLEMVSLADLAQSFGKAFIFSILISIISISKGLSVAGGADMLGKATTSSVVICIGSIIVADTFFALLL